MKPLVPSEYPDDAVEFTVTFLLPVTDLNRQEFDGVVCDLLSGTGLVWWPARVAHYVKYQHQLSYTLSRPPAFVRPKPKPKQRNA